MISVSIWMVVNSMWSSRGGSWLWTRKIDPTSFQPIYEWLNLVVQKGELCLGPKWYLKLEGVSAEQGKVRRTTGIVRRTFWHFS